MSRSGAAVAVLLAIALQPAAGCGEGEGQGEGGRAPQQPTPGTTTSTAPPAPSPAPSADGQLTAAVQATAGSAAPAVIVTNGQTTTSPQQSPPVVITEDGRTRQLVDAQQPAAAIWDQIDLGDRLRCRSVTDTTLADCVIADRLVTVIGKSSDSGYSVTVRPRDANVAAAGMSLVDGTRPAASVFDTLNAGGRYRCAYVAPSSLADCLPE